jgi:predicted dinucleotide-binding enzyme
MQVAIIGAGRVGGALALGLRGKGYAVTLGVRDPGKAEMQALSLASGATLASPSEASKAAEIVILALPWRTAETAVKALGNLSGKIVIDCMNPIGMVDGALGLIVGYTNSGGETLAGWLPGARVVKTLNQVGAEIMADPALLGHRPVLFMAGDDAGAKTATAELLGDLGFEALDAGDITKSRLLEPLGMVWINQSIFQGLGRDWAFSVTRKGT